MATREQEKAWLEILEKADAAGKEAVSKLKVVPMVVGEAAGFFGPEANQFKPGAKLEYVADGVCGFAYVHFKGNTAFGRWMKKTDRARPDSYHGGLYFGIHDYNQSMQKKEAYASAYVKVLRENGITDAWSRSRLD